MSGLTPDKSLEVVRRLTSIARDLSGADGATLVLRDGDDCYYADEDAIAPLWKGVRVPLNACISGWVMANKQPVAIEDVYADPRIAANVYRPTFVQSLVVVPVCREAPVAAIGAYWATRHRAEAREVAVLQSIADAAALALENVSLAERLQQAEAATRTRDEFLARLANELRTPLTAILGWAKILRTGRMDVEATRRAVEVIERNADSQRQLIGDLVDVGQVIAGTLVLQMSTVDLARVVRNVLESAGPAIEGKGLSVSVSFLSAAEVRGDAERLQQVVGHLVSNALKFTPAGGSIEVRLSRSPQAVTLTVSDSGAGIAPDVLPHVFERLRQADPIGPRKHAGLGVGLAIVRHVVELHGGTISAESGGTDQGATFTVEVPVETLARSAGVATVP